MNYLFHILTYFGIYAILSLSLNIVVGYCGSMTLAHAGYFAIGAYTYALGVCYWGMLSPVAMLLAFAAGGVASILISLPTWRLKGDYFVMVSMAVQVLLYSVAYNWFFPGAQPGSLKNLTNGPFGITGIPRPSSGGFTLDTPLSMSLLSLTALIFFIVLCYLLLNSPFGRVLNCLRDDELATRNLGKKVQVFRFKAFGIASGMAAFAGALYAAYTSYIDPSLASMDQSILLLSMIIVGGLGNLSGPLIGAVILLLIPEMLRFLKLPDSIAAETRIMLYGILLVVIVHIMPSGIAGKQEMK